MAHGRVPQTPAHRWSGRLVPPALLVGAVLLLGACGGGGAQQLTVSPGASTVAGQVPSMALRSSPAALEAPAATEPARVLAATSPVPPATPAASPAPASSAAAPEVGVLYGVVTRGGEAVPGARMTLKAAADGTERETTTDSTGTYRFAGVPAGAYELGTYAESGATCSADNCISAAWLERTELTLALGETRRLDVDGS